MTYSPGLPGMERGWTEKVYFERRLRLNTFALLTLLEPDRGYRTALQEMIWSICDEYTWCLPAHLNAESPGGIKGTIDLFSAETGFTLSEIRIRGTICLR